MCNGVTLMPFTFAVRRGSESTPKLDVMDHIVRRIADIIDHEAFDGDGTLGWQVAERLMPVLADVWDEGWRRGVTDGEKLRIGAAWNSLGDSPYRTYRTKDERRRAVFEVMDLEAELEQQERRHEP